MKQRILIYTLILFVFTMCNSKKTADTMQNDILDFEFNKEVTLTGLYTKSSIAKRGEALHTGHYKIVVNDTLEVILLQPYKKEAIRKKEEVESFEGKKVTVTGIIMAKTTLSAPSLENRPASVNIPCFITIESIELAEQKEEDEEE